MIAINPVFQDRDISLILNTQSWLYN